MKSKRKQSKRFFTLIELMVVILIIGLLAGLVGPEVLGRIYKAEVQSTESNLKALGDAVTSYKLDNHKLPSSLDELVRPDKSGARHLKQPEVPLDAWGKEFRLVVPGPDGFLFDIISDGDPKGKKRSLRAKRSEK